MSPDIDVAKLEALRAVYDAEDTLKHLRRRFNSARDTEATKLAFGMIGNLAADLYEISLATHRLHNLLLRMEAE